MRITADTNLLVRIVVRDDAEQARIAYELVSNAQSVAISLPCLCEVVWVLERIYDFETTDLMDAVRMIVGSINAVFDEAPVDAGLRTLEAGGDFADGVIAAAGNALGGEIFVSFDRKAVTKLNVLGLPARDARDLA